MGDDFDPPGAGEFPAEPDYGETRRLVYFYSVGDEGGGGKRAVLCPTCLFDGPFVPAEQLRAHYSAERTLRCSVCLIVIGPTSHEELEPL